MSSLTNFEIIQIAKYYKIKLVTVCFKDQLSNAGPIYGNYIVNLASSHDGTGGTHWVCDVLSPNDQSVHFDSYGSLPTEEEIIFAKPFGRLAHNDWILQELRGPGSDDCGWWCLAFLHYVTTHNGPKR